MEYSDFKQLVAKYASTSGIKDYELYFQESNNLNIEIFKDEVSKFSSNSNSGVGFRCIVHGKMGYASTELFNEEEAKELVDRAVDNARAIESEEEVLLHKKGDVYQEITKKTVPIPASDIVIQKALECQRAAYAADDRIVDGTQSVIDVTNTTISIYNSNGIDLTYDTSMPISFIEPIAKVEEEMYTSYSYTMKEIAYVDAKALAKKAVDDTIADIGADNIISGKYKVVFSTKTMATLLKTFFQVFSAERVQQGTSLLKGKENVQIASKLVTIIDDPFYAGSFLQVPFDAEGVATYTKEVIKGGTLQTYLHNLKTAKKDNVKTTANASKQGYSGAIDIMPYNFYLKPLEGTKEDLFSKALEGVYITDLQGMHSGANSVTGDFSLAAGGFLINDGKKASAVKGFTISGNFYDLLNKIEHIGADLEFLFPSGSVSLFGSPSVLVSEMSIAGK